MSETKTIEDVAREALELGPTATARPWAAVQPRSQDGGITVAHTGTCCADSFPTATSIRSLVAPGLLTTGQEQAARDAAFTVHACNHVEALAWAVLSRATSHQQATDDAPRLLAELVGLKPEGVRWERSGYTCTLTDTDGKTWTTFGPQFLHRSPEACAVAALYEVARGHQAEAKRLRAAHAERPAALAVEAHRIDEALVRAAMDPKAPSVPREAVEALARKLDADTSTAYQGDEYDAGAEQAYRAAADAVWALIGGRPAPEREPPIEHTPECQERARQAHEEGYLGWVCGCDSEP